MKPAPTIVITGQRRGGISRAGGIPDAGFSNVARDARGALRLASEGDAPGPGLAIAPTPHTIAYHHPRPVLGLFAERGTGSILKSIERQNANEGRAPLARHEKRILFRDISREFRTARDAAAAAFAPVVMFQFESIITDPHQEAMRLKRLVAAWWPDFDARAAALCVRRIKYVPRLICLKARWLHAPEPAA